MKIEIKVTKSNTRKKQAEKTKEETKKVNPISNHIKNMSITKKIIYGGLATFLATRAIDNLTEQNDIIVTPSQYENTNSNIKQTYETKSNNEQIKIMSDPIKVEAKEVLTDYTNAITYEEQKSVDTLYKDKYLEITGKVDEIIDNDTVRILNEDTSKWYSEWVGIECDFSNQVDLEKIQELQAGNEVSVIGYCIGYDEMTVEMDNCIFKDR